MRKERFKWTSKTCEIVSPNTMRRLSKGLVATRRIRLSRVDWVPFRSSILQWKEKCIYDLFVVTIPINDLSNPFAPIIDGRKVTKTGASVTEWSKVLRSGRSVFARVGSSPTACIFHSPVHSEVLDYQGPHHFLLPPHISSSSWLELVVFVLSIEFCEGCQEQGLLQAFPDQDASSSW